jgi:hypothetical protein
MMLIRTAIIPFFLLFGGTAVFGGMSPAAIQYNIKLLNSDVARLQKQIIAGQAGSNAAIKNLEDSLLLKSRQLDKQMGAVKTMFTPIVLMDSISADYNRQIANIRRMFKTFSILLTLFVLTAFVVTCFILRMVTHSRMEIESDGEFQGFFNRLKNALGTTTPSASSGSSPDKTVTPQDNDHELPIRVAEEIFRMRTRLTRMPPDTKGLSALQNAVGRLEDELNLKGYALVDMTGQSYYDEMTVSVKEFIPQDDLPAGKKRILRMLKPQIKFQDSIISCGEAEVAMSSEDLAQA